MEPPVSLGVEIQSVSAPFFSDRGEKEKHVKGHIISEYDLNLTKAGGGLIVFRCEEVEIQSSGSITLK